MILEHPPTREELIHHMGEGCLSAWDKLCAAVEEQYDMQTLWSTAGKDNHYEYKYRRGGKTLCALYVRDQALGFMIIFGREERECFEAERSSFCTGIQQAYDAAATYHDGKWVMFLMTDPQELEERLPQFLALLHIKRKPNRRG